ncbi:hypothetical protein [Streptomyces sp. AK02-04a]|nr:hypothetical protein [Streptomyces sp. AK02-04a]MDX3763797.1 hypothetical protein [Streptomyces sp. AK02-04a]
MNAPTPEPARDFDNPQRAVVPAVFGVDLKDLGDQTIISGLPGARAAIQR